MLYSIIILALFSIVMLFGLKSKNWHNRTVTFLWWLFVPIVFIFVAKKNGVVKSTFLRWMLLFLSPMTLILLMIVIVYIFLFTVGPEQRSAIPNSTPYHTAHDIYKVTGVEFPEVIQVDSIYYDEAFGNCCTVVSFIPNEPLTKKFFMRLDKACKEDTLCWKKSDDMYIYNIFPNFPLDRTNNDVSPYRMVDMDGDGKKEHYDWDGDYIRVLVPIKGDTITVEDGWMR